MPKRLSLLRAALGARFPWVNGPSAPGGRRPAGLPDGLPRRRLDRYRFVPPIGWSTQLSAHDRKMLKKTLRRQPPLHAKEYFS